MLQCHNMLPSWSPHRVKAAFGLNALKDRDCCCTLINWLQTPTTGRSCTPAQRHSVASLSASRGRPNVPVASTATAERSFATQESAVPVSRPRVCILGGGFGGLYTAVRLQSLIWPQGKTPQVTLIDQADKFVFKPLLYEVVGGSARVQDVAPSFVKLLAPYTVNFVQGSVKSIQPNDQRSNTSSSGGKIMLASGEAVEYDWLVLSLGSESTTMGIPGVKKHAFLFNSIDDAIKVQSEVGKLEKAKGSKVLVVGSGPAGVELATTMAERLEGLANIELISTGPQILKGLPSTHRESAERSLRRRGITVTYNTRVQKLRESGKTGAVSGLPLRTAQVQDTNGNKRDLEAELILWTAGSQPATKSKENNLPFPTTDKGTVKTFDTLQVVGNPRVFALGDLAGAAAEQQEDLPATAQVAFQQADYAAWNIWAAIHNRALLPFRYQHLGDMMSLGGGDGAVTLPIPVSSSLASAVQSGPIGSFLEMAGIRLPKTEDKGVTLEGPLGALVRRAAYLYRQPTDEHRKEVGTDWWQRARLEAGRGRERFSNL